MHAGVQVREWPLVRPIIAPGWHVRRPRAKCGTSRKAQREGVVRISGNGRDTVGYGWVPSHRDTLNGSIRLGTENCVSGPLPIPVRRRKVLRFSGRTPQDTRAANAGRLRIEQRSVERAAAVFCAQRGSSGAVTGRAGRHPSSRSLSASGGACRPRPAADGPLGRAAGCCEVRWVLFAGR